MNKLTLFFNYFSDPRFSDILEHFGVNNKGRRKALINQLLESESFQENLLFDFLYKTELQNFCKAVGISTAGNKDQIWMRIKHFLDSSDSNSFTIRSSSDMLMVNALYIVHKFEDYWSYDRNEESALKVLKKKHPELTIDDCKEAFSYALTAYTEAIGIVKANTESYADIESEKYGLTKREIKTFEKKFLEKYDKLDEQDCWIFYQIYFWYILK
ncbi:MAG: hypothetical protein ACTSQ4_12410 [Candidatus Heimdallarchaeaceae archaeon]